LRPFPLRRQGRIAAALAGVLPAQGALQAGGHGQLRGQGRGHGIIKSAQFGMGGLVPDAQRAAGGQRVGEEDQAGLTRRGGYVVPVV